MWRLGDVEGLHDFLFSAFDSSLNDGYRRGACSQPFFQDLSERFVGERGGLQTKVSSSCCDGINKHLGGAGAFWDFEGWLLRVGVAGMIKRCCSYFSDCVGGGLHSGTSRGKGWGLRDWESERESIEVCVVVGWRCVAEILFFF